MGDTQSAQRAGKKDAAEEDESGKVNDDQTVQNTEDKPLKNNGQISEINGKADSSIAALNGHCEDKLSAEDNDVAETEKTLKEEETPLENVETSNNKLPDEADANEVEPAEIIEMEEKQNDINESFRKFFSNIGLKLTVKKGSGEKGDIDVPREGPDIPEEVKDNVQEAKSENEEQNVDLNAAQEAHDYDSTACPTLTDGTSENFVESAETKTTESKEEAESDSADVATSSPAVSEDAHQDTVPEEEPCPKSPLHTNEMVVESPLKRFFTTGIFSSLKKKKKVAEDETVEKELVVMGENETAEIAEQALEEEEQNMKEIALDTEAVTTAKGLGEAEILPVVSIQVKDEVKSPPMDTSDSIVNEAELLSSQEKVQASPLKKLMSGSSFKTLSKKQKGKKSSEAKISDSQQQVFDQLLSSTDSAEYQKEGSPTQPSAPATEDEDSAWVAFKKLVTPKKRIKKCSLSNEQAQVSGSADEAKQSEEQQISDHSTDEGKKRKDSLVSWEAVLCGSGRRRSRKSSDSEEETPPTDAGDGKPDSGLKQGAESPLERSNEVQEIQEGSPPEGDGESTWKSFKKLVTPNKTKAKDEDESRDTMPSDNRVAQADSTFSIKKLLPGRKKRKPADQVSSDEADKEVVSDDEDSETPAVIPLSEFDADESGVHTQTETGVHTQTETGVHTQTETDVERYVPEEAVGELQQESAPPCDSLQIETQEVEDNEGALQNEASKTPATVEEPDDLTELISKYQQLSDIPEEGILTETMATPASTIEEAARDDTIAEDLLEITSEAITAPEPVDATVTDETEMISAVSQLSDSSKTSGNITPVPAEYNVKDTELLLGQVAENISASPHTVAVTSVEPSSERIVSSVSPQILETFEKEQPKILEIHKGSDETMINTDLNIEPIDAINELAANVQTESVPDVNDAVSTEIVSEVPNEEFYNAEITVDEVHEVSVIQGEENIKEEATDDSQHVPESVSEEKGELPQETSPEGEDVARDEGSLVGADQGEEDTSKIETQEAESAPFVPDENKDGNMKHKAQTLTETKDQTIQNVTEASQVEDQPSVAVNELEVQTNVEKDAILSEDDTVQSLIKKTPSLEDIPTAEAVADESKHLTEVIVEPENRETQAEAPKTHRYEVTDVLEVDQNATVDTEEDNVQSPEQEVPSSEDITPVESIDESKQTAEHLAEVTNEPETKEPQPDVSEVTEVSEVVQTTFGSEEDSVQKEIQSSEDVKSPEPVTDESKQTAQQLIEVTDEPETKEPPVKVPEEMEVVQTAIFGSEEDSVQKEIQSSEDVKSPEPVTDESKQTAEQLIEVTDEPETKEPQPDVSEVKEVSEVAQATLESQEDSVQKEIQSSPEPLTDESNQTAEHLAEVTVEIPNKEPPVEVPKEMEVVQTAIFGSEEDSVQKEIQSLPEPLTDESKQTEHLVTVTVEIQNKEPPVEVPKEMEVVQTAIFISEEDSVQKEIQFSEDVKSPEPVTYESKQTAEQLIEVTDEPETKEPQPDVSEVTEVSEVAQATLESQEDSVQKEIQSSKDIKSPEPVTDESKQTVEHLAEVTDEIQNKEPPVEVSEEMEVVQTAIFSLKEDSVQKEIQSSEDVQSAEPVTDESKQTAEHLTEVTNEPETKEPQPDVSEVTEVSEVVQTTFGSEEDSVQKEIQSTEDVQSTEPVTDESKQTTEQLIEVTDEPETKEPPVKVPEEMEVVQTAIFGSEEDSVQKEIQSSEDFKSPEPVTDDSKQTAEHLAEVTDKIQNKESRVEVPEEMEVVQTATFVSEERSIQSLSKEVIPVDIPPAETDQPNETEMVPLTEDKVEALDYSKTEAVQEPSVVQVMTSDSEAGSPQVIKEEIISKAMVTVETVTDVLRQDTVELEKAELVEAETSLPVIVPETDGKVSKTNVVAQSVDEISTQELETETLLEDVPKSDTHSVTEETEKKVVAQPDQDLELNKDQKPKSTPRDVQAEHEDRKAEALEETVTAAHVPCGAEDSHDQVLEETIFYEKTQAPCVDSPDVSGEPKHEKDLSTNQVSVEGEKAGKLQATEMNSAAAEHAVVMQVITCNLKDVSVGLMEGTPEIQEPWLERRVNEMKVADSSPLEKDIVNNTAEEGSVVVMMHAPSVEFGDNHRIQVQVVGVAVKSAESVVDSLIELGLTEAKEVIDVCHETLEKVETLSASPAFEEEVNNEENNLTVQEVIQHVKENLPETAPEFPEPDLLEQEVMKQPAVGEIVQSALEDQKMMKDSTGAHTEEKDEGHTIPAEQKVSEPQLQRSDLSLDVSTFERQEDLKETKAELQKSEVCVTTEAAKKDAENTTEAQRPRSTQSQIVAPSITELVAPQNTGMISSIGNVESPSSLSLEFKLNIQFGQPKAPASPPPPPTEPLKQPDMSTVAVQAVEAVEPTNVINAMQRVESEKQIELMEAAVQTTEITEPETVISYQPELRDGAVQKTDRTQPVEQIEPMIREAETAEPVDQITEPSEKTEKAMLSYQPVLQDVGIQAMETTELVEEIQSTQSIIPNIQAAETTEPVRQKEKRGVLISHPAVFEPFSEAHVKGKKAKEPIKQTEEENDDVWLDAEEDICTQEETEVSRLEVREPTEPQAESEQEEKEDLEPEFEMASNSKTEDGESHQRAHKTGGTCEIESEGEDFAVALEYPVTTISVPPAEWD